MVHPIEWPPEPVSLPFGFYHAVKIDSFAVFAAVYFVYLFPWKKVRRLMPVRAAELSS